MPNRSRDILTKQDDERVVAALRKIGEILPILDDAEACGIECQNRRDNLERKRKKLEAIRQRFIVGTL